LFFPKLLLFIFMTVEEWSLWRLLRWWRTCSWKCTYSVWVSLLWFSGM